MTRFTAIGRIFFGIGIMGIGVLHFFYPGIRPLIIPELTTLPYYLGYLIGVLLIGTGLLITIGKKFSTISLFMGGVFLALFLFGHLPYSLTGGSFNNYWVNTNKVLALSGGFLVISTINAPAYENRTLQWLARMALLGMYLYAIMLYNFAVGHFNVLDGISHIVPKYIPFPKFWTFLGGVALMAAAISIFSKYQVRIVLLLFALNLFIWLLSLHLYFAINFPEWQEGENFIGVFTCLCFCGTALVISQIASKAK